MANEILSFTEIASIIGFMVTLFVLYRVLIKQKNATIELQKERIALLSTKLDDAFSQSPDVLSENLSRRIEVLKGEIESLNQDGEKNKQAIEEKEKALHETEKVVNELQEKIGRAKKLFEEYTCPYCASFLVEREYFPMHGYVNGREVEADGEYLAFDCGYSLKNMEEVSPCPHDPTKQSA